MAGIEVAPIEFFEVLANPYRMDLDELEARATDGEALFTLGEAQDAAIDITMVVLEETSGHSKEASRCHKNLKMLAEDTTMGTFIGSAALLVPRLGQYTGEKLTSLDGSNPAHFPLAVDYICRLGTESAEFKMPDLTSRAKLLAQVAVNHLVPQHTPVLRAA